MKRISLAVPTGFHLPIAVLICFLCCAPRSFAQPEDSAQDYHDVATWLKAISSGDEQTRYTAALSLNSLGANKDSGLALLLKATKSADPFIRQYSAYALSNFQYKPELCLPALVSLFNDDSRRVRQMASVAATRFGNLATQYLLAAAADKKGKPSLEAAGGADDNNTEQPLPGSPDESETEDEHIKVTRVNLNAMIALRNLAATNLRAEIQSRKNIPVFEKNVILEPHGYEYEFTGYDMKVNYQKKIFKPFITTLKPDSTDQQKPDQDNGFTDDGLKDGNPATIDSQSIAKEVASLMSMYKDTVTGSDAVFGLLTNRDYLYPLAKPVFLSEIQRAAAGNCSPFLFTALYNAGAKARGLAPAIIAWLDTTKNTGYQRPLMYRCLLNILAGGNARYRLTDKYFQEIAPEFSGDSTMVFNLMMKPYYFYFLNANGLTQREKEQLEKDELHSYGFHYDANQFRAMADFHVDEKLVLYGSEIPSQPVQITDSTMRQFISEGLADSDYKIRCMALQFCGYLDKIDFPVNRFMDDNLMVQHYFFSLDNVSNINTLYPGFASLKSRYELDKQLILLYNRELLDLFAGEGTYGIGGWGAGGALLVMPKLPWPPPPASDRKLMDISGYTTTNKTLGTLYNRLKTALTVNSGVPESCLRVYAVPEGFALITTIEQTDENGLPLAGKDRWSKTVNAPGGWSGYLSTLLNGREGYFRSLSFIVCKNKNFVENGSFVADATSFAHSMYDGGGMDLPDDIKQAPAAGFSMNVLIYKFYKKNGGVISTVKKNSNTVPAEEYLRPMNILNVFKN